MSHDKMFVLRDDESNNMVLNCLSYELRKTYSMGCLLNEFSGNLSNLIEGESQQNV